MTRRFTIYSFCLSFLASFPPAFGQGQLEDLDRGLVAVPADNGTFLSWRLLNEETGSTRFRVYQKAGDRITPLQEAPSLRTNLQVAPVSGARYFVRAVRDGEPQDGDELNDENLDIVSRWTNSYWEIPIQPIAGYRPGDASVGDLDGDGQYEIVLHQVSRPRDNSHAGITGTPILDAYRLDGTHLWRIDLGVNIREGEHYTQFMVYDLDGDGRAEVACKTADGSKDGAGNVIGDATADYRMKDESDKRFGRILDGPEFLTVFDGLTGRALETVDYEPGRGPIDGWGGIGGNGNNDNYGNRCDRFLACVAYLDGQRPSLVMCRGVYGRIVLVAWDWRKGQLSRRWAFDSGISHPPFRDASPYSGMGGHSLSVADVDGDGKDEIVYQAMVVDDDGQGLYSSGLRHGDSLHVSDMYPNRPGLEAFTVQENEGDTVRFQTPGVAMRDARTGEILWSHSPGIDVGRGLAADIDPRYPGYEAWGNLGGLRDAMGNRIGAEPRSTNFAIWWDGDLLREFVSSTRVTKWNWEQQREETLFTPDARAGGRGPNLVADILGDWREELLLTSPDGRSLRLYTTTIPTEHSLPTLMHDRQYRLGVAWQNVVYNKPAHPSFFLGHGMEDPAVSHDILEFSARVLDAE